MTFGDFKYERTDSGIRIDKYTGSASSVNIPAQINGVPVTSIGDRAFYGCSSLTSIVIPDSVTTIGGSAFYYCKSLTSIVIPDSVTTIGGSAFYYCKSLTSVVIPNSVTTIGNQAFRNCKSLASVVIPNSVTSIGGWAFKSCKSLKSITIPDSVTTIGNRAFRGCSSLTSIVIPDSVTTIGNQAFRGCSSLTSIVIPHSVTSIGDYAFEYCFSLTSIVIPNSVTTIGKEAFSGCKSLASVVIPDSVTTIGNQAFSKCESLKTIYFPRSLKNRLQSFCNNYETKIHYYNFPTKFFIKINRLQNASNLPDDIRTSVKQLETLFYSNKYTSTMNSDISKILDDFITIQELQQKIETNSVINLITLVNGVSQKKITNVLKYIQTFNDEIDKIKVAAQENLRALTGEKPAAKRQTAPVTGKPQNTQSGSVTSAADSGGSQNNLPNKEFFFKNNSTGITIIKYNGSADSVNIPSQINGLPVTSISDRAFYGCESLTSVVIPDSVTSIGTEAFNLCTSLTSIYFPYSLLDVNGRDNMLKNFRSEYNDKIRYYNTVSEIKELMESPDFEK